MVSLCEDSFQFDFLPADPYAARITALSETYGSNQKFAMFWVQKIDDAPVAAVCRVDGNMTLCALENADYEELSAFIGAVGFLSLTCDAAVAEKLGLTPSKTSYTVRYNGGYEPKEGVHKDCDKRSVYNLLCECGFELGDYGSFLADVCARLNKGTASMAVREENGVLQACAFALFKGAKSVLLGAVATSPEARGRGYASELVGYLANAESDKQVYLFCREDSLAVFYGKIGFETVGKWAIIEEES
jgi:N-acetylglutamate synthase-like GNAT family acetyltransferase